MMDDSVATRLGRILKRAHPALVEAVTVRLISEGSRGLRPTHIQVLDNLDFEGTRLTALAERARISHQGMGELVDELVDLGLLERIRDPEDRRARLVRPTQQGMAEFDRAAVILRQIISRWQRELGEAPVTHVLEGVATLIQVCEQYLDESQSGQ